VPAPLISLLPQFDQVAGTLGTRQDMEILRIGKIEFLRRVDPPLQGCVIDTTNPFGIGMFFENVLPKLLKKQPIVVIILQKRLTLVHDILSGRGKYLCRSLLRST
jgi:hypothetical protein